MILKIFPRNVKLDKENRECVNLYVFPVQSGDMKPVNVASMFCSKR